MNTVRVAVLGTGAIAQIVHLPILTRMRGVSVTGVFDSDRRKAGTLAERFGVERTYRSEEELWSDPELDAVVVCTPSHLHEEQVRTGLQAGKFVFCEKPLALSTSSSERILETEGARERLMVGMNERFRPDASALKSFVAGGELGDPFYLRAGWLNRRAGGGRANWRLRRERSGGGALMDLGFQLLDLALWLLDYPEPQRLVAHTHRSPGAEVEDSAALLLELENDRIVNLEVTWSLISKQERQYLHLLGSSGSGSLAPLRVYKELDGELADVTPQLPPGREHQYTASYRQELARFLELVRGEREPIPPLEQVALLRIIDAAYESAEQRREVRF
jgi:predicted dehydrogenase